MGSISLLVALVLSITVRSQGTFTLDGVLPQRFSGSNRVYSDFFGISIESSHLDLYFGQSPSSIPPPVVNYLSNIRIRSQRPLRIRIGGNSMDDTTYNPNQPDMIMLTGINNTANKQPAILGPPFFDTMKAVSDDIGGAKYLVGLGLIHPSNVSEMALAAKQKLGDSLDAFLLGNEPDLYGPHGDRTADYSIENYFQDFNNATQLLKTSPGGDLLLDQDLGGPTTCCRWDLLDLINQGYLQDFGNELKYINLQHYPQNNCDGHPSFGIDYYTQHSNVVELSKWQLPGVDNARSAGKQVTMGEFNTAACGGIPEISDTFAAAMWAVDYVLQLASVGYSGAYIHTREAGITYNILDPPVNGSDWAALPVYYAFLPVAEALRSVEGMYVLDLNLNNSTNTNSSVAGYGVYNSSSGDLANIVLFNFANQGSDEAKFAVPAMITPNGSNNTMTRIWAKFLTAPSVKERSNISWSGKTLFGHSDGQFGSSDVSPDEEIDCTGGCSVKVPAPGIAVVWSQPTTGKRKTNSAAPLSFTVRIVDILPIVAALLLCTT